MTRFVENWLLWARDMTSYVTCGQAIWNKNVSVFHLFSVKKKVQIVEIKQQSVYLIMFSLSSKKDFNFRRFW